MATQPSYSIDLVSEIADELTMAAQRAQSATNASGAAIAVREANANEFFCRASSGSNAPDVGAVVRIEGTLTGICIESGKELLCDDTEIDTRVDTTAARALGIRSLLVIPITEEKRVSGVLAVFATMPHAFSDAQAAALKVLADQVAAVLQKRGAAAQEHIGSPVRPVPAVLKMFIPATGKEAGRSLVSSNGDKSKVGSVTFTRSDGGHPEHKIEPASSLKHRLEAIGAARAKLAKAAGNKLIGIGIIAAVLAVILVVAVMLKRGKSGPPTPAQASQHEQQSLAPSQPDGVQADNAFTNAMPEGVENREDGLAGKQSEQPEGSYQKPSDVSVRSPKIAERPLISQTQQEDVAPNLNLGHGPASDLALLAQPVISMPPAMASSSNLVKARLIHVVNPIYPNIAKTSRISGSVVMEIMVGKDGKVTNPRFIKGPVVLRDAALDAVKQWIFQPAMLDGHPMDQGMRVTLKFTP